MAFAVLLANRSPVAAQAAETSDPGARRKEVQEQRAQKAAEVDVLKASDDELDQALDAMDTNLRGREVEAATAAQAAAAAAASAAQARRAERATAARLDQLRQAMRREAVDAYVRGPSDDVLMAFDSSSVPEMVSKQQMMRVAMGAGADRVDELRAAREDLALKRAVADKAEQTAAARRMEVDVRLGELRQSQAQNQQVAISVEQRLEQSMAEAASLAALDGQLAADIARRQAALAVRIAPSVRATGGAPRPSGPSIRLGPRNLATVRGIVVASEIAGRLEALLAAAQADGFQLGGGGYRSSDGQIAARRANCGGDVYNKPASQCSPPTARPGQSMHERGLAVDFTWNGRLISSGNPAFQWLRGNAGRFGLYNLPREPWHWSVNGQ
ncbi:MAG: D-alanyl-D-alanine carboxypeptidase family protein [Actinomycetota bacterium]|nr:D-alanyl-D-alanine carboxypeptidase family protein [Actinomycetota bacterium]